MHEGPMMSILIRRSVEDVFNHVMDIERTPSWRPRMSEVRWIAEGEPGPGSRFRVVVRTLGLTVRFEPEIAKWDPPHAVSFRQSTGPAQMESFYECRPEGGYCRFLMGGRTGTEGWMRFLAPMVGRSIVYQNMKDLVRLKSELDSNA